MVEKNFGRIVLTGILLAGAAGCDGCGKSNDEEGDKAATAGNCPERLP